VQDSAVGAETLAFAGVQIEKAAMSHASNIVFCMDPTAPTRSTSCPFNREMAASTPCARSARGVGSGIPRSILSVSDASEWHAIGVTMPVG
jgi:hypothetical protein